jgi:streptogramin lyase
MDDMNGTNWTVYGGNCGSGPGLFSDPSGIAVDAAGKIYVMDSGNSQVVRIDDMNGANWVAYGSPGSGTGQFVQGLQSIAVDSSGRIYVADTGNKRIVRIDDMTGTNWTALTQSQPINGATYSFYNPQAVAVGQDGKSMWRTTNTISRQWYESTT